MAGLLDGQLAKTVYAAFRGKLQNGTLWRAVPTISGGLDSQGDPLVTVPMTWPIQGFREDYSDFFRANGIPKTDSKINIFAQSIAQGTVAPLKDDKVNLAGQWWQIRRAGTDPAT